MATSSAGHDGCTTRMKASAETYPEEKPVETKVLKSLLFLLELENWVGVLLKYYEVVPKVLNRKYGLVSFHFAVKKGVYVVLLHCGAPAIAQVDPVDLIPVQKLLPARMQNLSVSMSLYITFQVRLFLQHFQYSKVLEFLLVLRQKKTFFHKTFSAITLGKCSHQFFERMASEYSHIVCNF